MMVLHRERALLKIRAPSPCSTAGCLVWESIAYRDHAMFGKIEDVLAEVDRLIDSNPPLPKYSKLI